MLKGPRTPQRGKIIDRKINSRKQIRGGECTWENGSSLRNRGLFIRKMSIVINTQDLFLIGAKALL